MNYNPFLAKRYGAISDETEVENGAVGWSKFPAATHMQHKVFTPSVVVKIDEEKAVNHQPTSPLANSPSSDRTSSDRTSSDRTSTGPIVTQPQLTHMRAILETTVGNPPQAQAVTIAMPKAVAVLPDSPLATYIPPSNSSPIVHIGTYQPQPLTSPALAIDPMSPLNDTLTVRVQYTNQVDLIVKKRMSRRHQQVDATPIVSVPTTEANAQHTTSKSAVTEPPKKSVKRHRKRPSAPSPDILPPAQTQTPSVPVEALAAIMASIYSRWPPAPSHASPEHTQGTLDRSAHHPVNIDQDVPLVVTPSRILATNIPAAADRHFRVHPTLSAGHGLSSHFSQPTQSWLSKGPELDGIHLHPAYSAPIPSDKRAITPARAGNGNNAGGLARHGGLEKLLKLGHNDSPSSVRRVPLKN